jgi:inhibitor of KinA
LSFLSSQSSAYDSGVLPPATLTPAGDSGLRLTVADAISPAAHEAVMAWLRALDRDRPPFVVDVVPAYRSLLVVYDCARAWLPEVRAWVEAARDAPMGSAPPPRLVEVPVWYDAAVGPDLSDVAARAGVTVDEVVRRHTIPEYRVHMLGFRPGFPFLAGLDPLLHTPRLPSPRVSVAAGSVGIGGAQTGIYPVASPGGWRLIGRTPLRLFDPASRTPFRLAVGDRIRFVAIDDARYRALGHP